MTWTPDQPIISLTEVRKSFGDLEVLKGVSLDVMKGEVICVIGPSGSGKSTLIRCINALNPINSGSIKVEGQEVNDPNLDKLELRKKVGMVFQHFNLFPHMTAIQNCMEGPVQVLGLSKAEARDRGEELLELVGMADKKDQHPSRLSGGQQQRVAIARALAMRPKVMLFDEVTSALDPEVIGEVTNVIRKLVSEHNLTMLMVTHQMGFARDISDRVCFFYGGKIEEQGKPADLFGNPQKERTQQFLSAVKEAV